MLGPSASKSTEQAATAVQTTQAQLQAVDAEIREQRVELGYHNVTAPTAGVVGDIPVRVGDRVTQQTVLTTVDENAGLELYINVPVQQATGLKNGLMVRLVDDAGKEMGVTAVNFVSPTVEVSTQSVLVKAPITPGMPVRTDQFVRVHVVWALEPGITVPLVSVTRINGQYFVYVVENGEGGATIARQRAVQLGQLVGNDYLLIRGLKAGERLVTAGVQKIGDGMPVQVAGAR